MAWIKLGKIFSPVPKGEYLCSHASNPTALWLQEDVFRVYYNGRNINNKSSIFFFDFDLKKMKQEDDETTLVAPFGDSNGYYSHGLSNGCLLVNEEEISLLCMAWQIRGEDHWRGDIAKVSLNKDLVSGGPEPTPFLTNDDTHDHVSLSYPWILKEGSLYKMWYGSTISWDSPNGEMVHVINYATSKDAVNWVRHGLAIPYEIGKAQAFSRPTVIKDKKGYHMWFSYRSGDGTLYRIGYAHSHDSVNWSLDLEKAGITVSKSGWDSEMICYPFVFEHDNKRYMLYNGNAHGKTGIGLAIWEG
ncbi:hypothetical protein [Roseivirga sp.]|uniref:hypothetical protein n=1 Tax=Roseivirga sp. TaxID=1964215 RepID=UPI003B8B307D